MISFTCIPAFGFETTTYNATECCVKEVNKRFSKVNGCSYEKEKELNAAKTAWKAHNLGKVLGYIPIIGTLIGLARIGICATQSQEECPNKYNFIARGCIESLSLGFLLVIPDLILTGYRACCAGNPSPSEVEV